MQVLEGHSAAVHTLAFAPDGRFLVSGSTDGRTFRWDGSATPAAVLTGCHVAAVAVHPLGHAVVVGTPRSWLWIQVEPQVELVRPTREVFGPVAGLGYLSPTLLAVGYGDRVKQRPGRLVIWEDRQPTFCQRAPSVTAPHGVRSIAVHPPSNRVAWSEWDRRLFVWDPVKPDPVRFNLPHNAASVAFHPDGGLLAAAQEWGVRVYDLDRRQEKYHATGHKGQVTGVAFSPDGRTLATGSWDGTVRYWDAATGRETACYTWPTGKVFALAYAPDGLRLAAGGATGSVVVWDVD